MNQVLISVALGVFGLGAIGLVGYLVGRFRSEREEGEKFVRDEITQEALDAAKHEAEILALPARDKSDVIASLRRKAKD